MVACIAIYLFVCCMNHDIYYNCYMHLIFALCCLFPYLWNWKTILGENCVYWVHEFHDPKPRWASYRWSSSDHLRTYKIKWHLLTVEATSKLTLLVSFVASQLDGGKRCLVMYALGAKLGITCCEIKSIDVIHAMWRRDSGYVDCSWGSLCYIL